MFLNTGEHCIVGDESETKDEGIKMPESKEEMVECILEGYVENKSNVSSKCWRRWRVLVILWIGY